MNKIICYINDNYIDIKKNKKICHYITSSIKNGDIINSKLFIKEFKNKNIFSNILTSEITLYFNHIILEKDLYYYKSIFDELNCTKINIYDTSKKLTSPTLIANNNNYIIYYNNDFYNIIPNFLESFLSINNIKVLKIISNKKILNLSNVKYYYYNNFQSYFLR